ncbi:MAG: alpha/beta hydrolase, partial [Deltaproteobacteria bacterium]|nr:alpha/beta hydrolase [Deltaproteobacteria bacterium]
MAFPIFVHCFTCTKKFAAAENICRALSQQRIVVLRFDFTGFGESPGEFETSTFPQNVADLVAANRYLSERHRSPEILIGHSIRRRSCTACSPSNQLAQSCGHHRRTLPSTTRFAPFRSGQRRNPPIRESGGPNW